MNRIQTSILSVALIVGASILGLNLARINPHNASDKTVSVSGEGKAMQVPDIYSFSVSARADGKTTKEVNKKLAETIDQALKVLKSHSIADNDIQSNNVNISEKWNYESGSSKRDGYEGSHTLTIKLRNVATAGKLIDDLTNINDLLVNGGSYTLDDDDTVLQAARNDAFTKAKNKAQELAQLAGMKLGKVLSLDESIVGGNYPQPLYGMRDMAMEGAGGASSSMAPGEQQYNVIVNAVFELK